MKDEMETKNLPVCVELFTNMVSTWFELNFPLHLQQGWFPFLDRHWQIRQQLDRA